MTAFLTWRGTAIAPPLVVLVLLAALAAVAAAGRAEGVTALTVVAAATIVGYFGEPLVRHLLFAAPEPTKTTLVAVQLALTAAVVALGIATLAKGRFV